MAINSQFNLIKGENSPHYEEFIILTLRIQSYDHLSPNPQQKPCAPFLFKIIRESAIMYMDLGSLRVGQPTKDGGLPVPLKSGIKSIFIYGVIFSLIARCKHGKD